MLHKGTADEDKHVIIGGLRYRRPNGLMANYTAPLARLEIEHSGIRIVPSGKLAVGMITIELPWEFIARVQRVRGILLGSPGVRILKAGGGDERIVFWTFERDTLLRALGEYGVTVEPRGGLVWLGT